MISRLPVSVITQQLMKRTLDGNAVTLPFSRDIFLLETHIAGIEYCKVERIESKLEIGSLLTLRREPRNDHDNLAIEVIASCGVKLGYVPRNRNTVLAHLMDAGKSLVAEAVNVSDRNEQLTIRLKIVLREG